jgi:peptidoglycan hydrolase CwlO-like protein
MLINNIMLAQSVSGAVATIVGLLLVAALIGYLTAWFYAKSVYTPIIKKLEKEKADLQTEVAALKEEISKLNSRADEMKKKIASLEELVEKKEKELRDLKKKE